MEVRWSLPAAEDLERVCERIQRDNPDAARRVAKIILGRDHAPRPETTRITMVPSCQTLPPP